MVGRYGESSTGGSNVYDTDDSLNVSAFYHEEDGRLTFILVSLLDDAEEVTLTLPDGVTYEAFNTSGGLGTLCETLAGKVRALLDGRPSVSIDDVRAVAPAALRHRLVLGYEAVADGVTADDLVADLLAAIPAPSAQVSWPASS